MRWLFRKIAWSRAVRVVPEGLTYLGWRPRHKPPSFVESISRSVRLREIAAAQGLDFPVWRLDDKLAGREFAQEIGLRVPELYRVGSVEECVAEVVRRGSGVIKPRQRHDSIGVVSLTSRGEGFFDHIRKQTVSAADLESYVRGHQVGQEDVLFVEELIFRPGGSDLPSFDWKMYCFFGEVGLAVQYQRVSRGRRSLIKVAPRRSDFTFVPTPWRRRFRQSPTLPGPAHPRELVEAAQSFSLAAQVAFARIDLFEDDRGPVFGEITPHPSAGFKHGNFYGRDLDRQMGQMWEEAEVRLASSSLDRLGDRG
jgi:hypothetical protein